MLNLSNYIDLTQAAKKLPINSDLPIQTISAKQDSFLQYANPIKMGKNLWRQRELTAQLIKREILQRYKGSYLGIVWSFVTPLVMLLVYTFIFSVIFQTRWSRVNTGSHIDYALPLFAGLLVFNIFSEALLAAPRIIVETPNYVKKVVFPLELLPISALGASLIHSIFSLAILLLGVVVIWGVLPWTLLLLPIVYFPLILLCLGLSWFLASLGVFIRDISHLLDVGIRILFFLTPIVYPISMVPDRFHNLLYLNPLTYIVEYFQGVILWGQSPNWNQFLLVVVGSFVVCMLGYIWFMKTKKFFADVI